jgi:hypothetical protein
MFAMATTNPIRSKIGRICHTAEVELPNEATVWVPMFDKAKVPMIRITATAITKVMIGNIGVKVSVFSCFGCSFGFAFLLSPESLSATILISSSDLFEKLRLELVGEKSEHACVVMP